MSNSLNNIALKPFDAHQHIVFVCTERDLGIYMDLKLHLEDKLNTSGLTFQTEACTVLC